MNSVTFSVEVKAKTSSVRATWTTEMIKDISSYHNTDIEKDLENLLRAELIKERASNRKNSINKIFNNI
jgi:hypothetical protein